MKTSYQSILLRTLLFFLSVSHMLHAEIEGMITLYLHTPSQAINTPINKDTLPVLSGFFCTYGGYCDYSDDDGLIAFPLRHTAPKIYLLIARTIKMESIKPNTISHPEIPTETAAKLYVFEKKEDPKRGYYYWDIRPQELPEDGKINDITLVIMTNPDNIYVPIGKKIIFTPSPHLILPPIYVVGNKEHNTIALETTDLKKFLEEVSFEQKQSAKKKMIRRRTTNP